VTWDIYALRGPGGARTVEQIPQDWQPPPIGSHEEIAERLREAVPQADVTDPTWLRIRGEGWLVEAALGKAPQVHDVSFYVTGGEHPDAVGAVLRVTRALRITAYDTETGEILTPESRPPVVPPPGEDEDDEPRRPWWRFWQKG
jgi:hypothetical protein